MGNRTRIGIINDLHIGHEGTGEWHNRLLYDRAGDIVRAAVAQLNSQKLDRVIILGDITNDGCEPQLTAARAILDTLHAPCFIIPGNHDRAAVRSGGFVEVFGDRVPGMVETVAGFTSLFLSEYLPEEEYPRTELGNEYITKVIETMRPIAPRNLLVFSHFPLISREAYAEEHNGRYAKHYLDGEDLLDRLEQIVPGTIVCFAGHQHWHHVTKVNGCTHCMTASLIEYPMEARLVIVDKEALTCSILDTASPGAAEESFGGASWVTGLESDRNIKIKIS